MTRDMVMSTTVLHDCGLGEVGQAHVGVNGIVKDEEEENCQGEGGWTEERNIWYLVRCYTVRG